jgi:hypothetical protein
MFINFNIPHENIKFLHNKIKAIYFLNTNKLPLTILKNLPVSLSNLSISNLDNLDDISHLENLTQISLSDFNNCIIGKKFDFTIFKKLTTLSISLNNYLFYQSNFVNKNSFDVKILPNKLLNELEKINIVVIPSSVTNLTLNDYDGVILKNQLPPNLRVLKLDGGYFNHQILKDCLPSTLRSLSFNDEYNQPFNIDVLPKNLKTLKLGEKYNQKFEIEVLPKKLSKLIIGGSYNQTFEKNVLPQSLNKLYLGFGGLFSVLSFNQNINELVLPNNLQKLYISSKFYSHDVKGENLLVKFIKLFLNNYKGSLEFENYDKIQERNKKYSFIFMRKNN